MKPGQARLLIAAPHRLGLGADSVAGFKLEIDLVHSLDGALKVLERGYDCCILDLETADHDPLPILRQVRERGLDTPVVLISHQTDAQGCLRLLQAGAADCLSLEEVAGERLPARLRVLLRAQLARRELAAAEHEVTQRLLRDPLTRLPNRLLFLDRLERALAVAHREQKPVALLLADLNDFNAVNQTLGHHIGDRLLEVVAGRLAGVLRSSDTLGRLGDDEFAALLPTGATANGALITAGKMADALSQPLVIEEHRFTIGSAIGVALYPLHGATADELLRCAASALRAAKRDAVGVAVYAGEDLRYQSQNLSLAHDLRQALENGELLLHYQPKIDMETARISGVEALVRWRHPERGLLLPDTFIAAAEQAGVIEGLTRWVINAALRQYRRWAQQGYDFTVSVNLSALSLHNHGLAETVQALLAIWAVPAGRLTLEITESAIISHVMRASETLERLHRLGVRIAIDDFGTGYTSLANLRKLPVNELKVDKSFVMQMHHSSDDAVIVRTIIELARNLGLRVVAEGVEDAATWDLLHEFGCTVAQGYYMARPLDAAGLERWLQDSRWGIAPAAADVEVPRLAAAGDV